MIGFIGIYLRLYINWNIFRHHSAISAIGLIDYIDISHFTLTNAFRRINPRESIGPDIVQNIMLCPRTLTLSNLFSSDYCIERASFELWYGQIRLLLFEDRLQCYFYVDCLYFDAVLALASQ